MLPQARPAPAPAIEPLGPPPLELLSPRERRTFRLIDHLARHALPWTERFNRTVSAGWMTLGSGRMLKFRGVERIAHLRSDDGILLIANHRSFFDLFMLSTVLHRETHLHQPVFAPVRADFFYQHPLGMVVNLLTCAGRMYPPIFREPAKLKFNQWSIARVGEMLRAGNVVVGFHPEGRRNKNPDPYQRLPAHPGAGKLVMDSWPVVVPAFILGMSNNILADIKANYTGERHAIAVFGDPIDLSPFRHMSNRLANHKRVADHLLEVIYSLGEEERQAREEMGLPALGPVAIG